MRMRKMRARKEFSAIPLPGSELDDFPFRTIVFNATCSPDINTGFVSPHSDGNCNHNERVLKVYSDKVAESLVSIL